MDESRQVGKRISLIRGTLSKAAFARKLGVQPPYIGMLESGKSSASLTLTKLICIEFCIYIEWLLTGKGWAYIPSATYQATEWMENQLENTKRILIIEYDDNKMGTPYGFVLEKEKGYISMRGDVTRSDVGYTGGKPNAYRDILKAIKDKGIPIDKIKFNKIESIPLDDLVLSDLFINPSVIRDIDIDKELHLMRPDTYSEKVSQISITEEEADMIFQQEVISSHPEIAEIIAILIRYPEVKKFILKILKGREYLKDGMEGLSRLKKKTE